MTRWGWGFVLFWGRMPPPHAFWGGECSRLGTAAAALSYTTLRFSCTAVGMGLGGLNACLALWGLMGDATADIWSARGLLGCCCFAPCARLGDGGGEGDTHSGKPWEKGAAMNIAPLPRSSGIHTHTHTHTVTVTVMHRAASQRAGIRHFVSWAPPVEASVAMRIAPAGARSAPRRHACGSHSASA